MAMASCAASPPAPPPIDSYTPATVSEQLAEVGNAIRKYDDIAVAKREGWKPFGGDEPLMGQHWYDPNGPDYVHGDAIDFTRPSNLMYTRIGDRQVLTGVAFVVRIGPGEPLPAGFAGDDDLWHVHDVEAAVGAATEDRPVLGWIANWWLDANYRSKGDDRARLAMVHAWVTLPNPDGVFAHYNRLVPYLQAGVPPSFADGGSEAAARGLALVPENGCENAVGGRLWIANATREQKRRLMITCESAASSLRSALPSDKDQVNAAAERAWTQFQQVYVAELTDDQKRRIAALTEHGSHSPSLTQPAEPHHHH
jgi:hypothetical protein